MTKTNEDEWLFTPYDRSLLIGAIVGFPIGAISGLILWNMTGLYLGLASGITLSAISCFLNVLMLNFRTRPKKIKEIAKEDSNDKEDILKQLKALEKRLKK